MCHVEPECAPSWTSDEAFGNMFGLQHIPTCTPCDSELTPNSDTCKAMVASATPMETVNHVKLYFDTFASKISTPFNEESVTTNEDHTDGTLNIIASDLTI